MYAMAIYPPTATFKGEHDGAGNLDKNVIRQAELAETGRYPTARSYMSLLWSQKAMTPRDLDDPQRRTHEIDGYIRMYVNDLPNTNSGDNTDSRIIITDKAMKKYECTHVPWIQSSYNAIVFRYLTETGEVGTKQSVYLRNAFCSCDNCRGATKPEDYINCR